MRLLRSGILVGVACGALVPSAATAQTSAQPVVLTSVPLPGGYGAVAPLRIGPGVPPAQLLPLLIKALHATPPGTSDDVDARRSAFLAASSALSNLQAAVEMRPDGVALEDAGDRQKRSDLRGVLRLLGLELVEQRDVVIRLDDGGGAERLRASLASGGVEPLDVLNRLNAGERVRVVVPAVPVPFPLERSVWERWLGRDGLTDARTVGAVLEDRRASLVLFGLLGMDAETLEWLAATPDALRAVWDHPASVAIAGSSIRIRDAALQLPGGSDAVRAWEALTGARASRPAQFVRQVLGRDGGRLAVFFDAIAKLDEPHLRFVLASSRRVREPLRALYAAATATDETCQPDARPFVRCQFDTPVVLRSAVVQPSGALAGPTWRSFWTAVVAGEPPSARTATARWLQKDGDIDAVWLASQVSSLPARDRPSRLHMLLFAQRVFANASEAEAAEMAFVLAQYGTYEALPLTLERMGVRAAATYANAIRAAQGLARVDADLRGVAFAQFQGALAMLERLRRREALGPSETEAAANGLFALQLDSSRLYEGRLAEWLRQQVAPAWRRGRPSVSPSDEDAALIQALAGAGRSSRADAFSWEGERYTTRVAEHEAARLQGAFAAVTHATIGTALHLSERIAAIERATSADDLRSAAAAAGDALEAVTLAPAAGVSPGRAREIADDARDGIRNLLEIRQDRDLDRVRGRLRPVARLLEYMTADALRAAAYVIGSSAEDVSNLPVLAARHDFGHETEPTDEDRQRMPWRLASPVTAGSGTHLLGSLLALDVVQSASALRRLGTGMPPRPPTVDAAAQSVLSQAIVLADPAALTDSDRDAIAAAIRRGRERIASADPAASLDQSAAPGIRGARLDWAATHTPARRHEQFTLVETMRLGAIEPIERLDLWGVSQRPVTGCLCLRTRGPVAWETLAGRPASSEPAAHFGDLGMRLAEAMSDLRVPAVLFPAILAFATQDLIDAAVAADDDDMMALAVAVAAISSDRIADYVASVVGRGFAEPAGEGESR